MVTCLERGAYDQDDAIATLSYLASLKSRLA